MHGLFPNMELLKMRVCSRYVLYTRALCIYVGLIYVCP